MTASLQSQETIISELRQKHEQLAVFNESLSNELQSMTTKVDQLTASRTVTEADHKRIVEGLQSEIAMLKQQMASDRGRSSHDNQHHEESAQSAESERVRAQWKEAMDEVESLKEQLSAKRVMVEDKVLEMSALTIKYEESLDLLRRNETDWERQKTQILEAVDGEQKEMEERHRKEVEKLTDEMERKHAEIERLKDQYERLRRRHQETSVTLSYRSNNSNGSPSTPSVDEAASQSYMSNITMAKWFK